MFLNNFILVVFFVTVTTAVEREKGLFGLRFKKRCIPSTWNSVVAGVRKQIKAVPSLLTPVSFLFSLGPA